MKTVILAGAGLSAASTFALPVMSTFFCDGVDPGSRLGQLLEWLYPDSARDTWNLEEVLSFLETAKHRTAMWGDRVPHEHPTSRPDQLYLEAVDFVKRRLSIPPDETCELHSRLLGTLSPPDTVITLNYDLVADQALVGLADVLGTGRTHSLTTLLADVTSWDVARPAVPYSPDDEGLYLKLHGSLDWLRCPSLGCSNHSSVYPVRFAGGDQHQTEGRPCRLCGADLQAFLVPPLPAKRLEDRGRLALLWRLALEQLARADRLVLIGVSLAATDFELRWLLRQGAAMRVGEQSVHVVNPSASARDTATRVLPRGSRAPEEFETIEEWLETS